MENKEDNFYVVLQGIIFDVVPHIDVLLQQEVELVTCNSVLQDHFLLVQHDNYLKEEKGIDKNELVD